MHACQCLHSVRVASSNDPPVVFCCYGACATNMARAPPRSKTNLCVLHIEHKKNCIKLTATMRQSPEIAALGNKF